MIDLHLHTTSSDGRLTPAALVDRAAQAGLRTIAITDHDTTAALDEARAHAAGAGVDIVTGIELTSVYGGRDVHILGYGFDAADARLNALLETQRALRVERTRAIGARLASLGVPIDVDALLAGTRPGRSVGRPLIARALVERGCVASVQEAFDRYLASGQPAFVPREGRGPADVVRAVHDAGGVVSFAHPGVTKQDALIDALAADGLDAIEVYHSDHPPDTQHRYLELARRLGLLVSGGSDFHGDGERRATLGVVSLPPDDFAALMQRAATHARAAGRA